MILRNRTFSDAYYALSLCDLIIFRKLKTTVQNESDASQYLRGADVVQFGKSFVYPNRQQKSILKFSIASLDVTGWLKTHNDQKSLLAKASWPYYRKHFTHFFLIANDLMSRKTESHYCYNFFWLVEYNAGDESFSINAKEALKLVQSVF